MKVADYIAISRNYRKPWLQSKKSSEAGEMRNRKKEERDRLPVRSDKASDVMSG